MLIRIKETLQAKGFTMRDLHKTWLEKFPDSQITLQTLYHWSDGSRQPKYDDMERLCVILDISFDKLFQAQLLWVKEKYDIGKPQRGRKKVQSKSIC